ncbi:thiamine phosphate synthase [soil metagenome]
MLIVISEPDFIDNEANLINQLFDEGMQLFHLRKPDSSREKVKALLKQISSDHYNKIALHQHYKIAEEFGIKRIHYPEKIRKDTSENDFKKLKAAGHILSTSVHRIKKYKALSAEFDYTFLGPVFNSISKTGYTSARKEDFTLEENKTSVKVIALGGIKEVSIQEAFDLHFDGVAVLGAVWQQPETAVDNFKRIKELCNQIAR